MNILIRCDMGGIHGWGHAVRCKALAGELVRRGARVGFVTTSPGLSHFVAPLPCQIRSPVCMPLEEDVFIVDTKDAWMESLLETLKPARTTRTKVVRIDHPTATADSCHLLIGPCNHWAEDTVATLRASFRERFLYGWDYVMLTPETVRADPLPLRHGSRFGIVFCAGGSDPTGVLERMMEWGIHLELSPPLVFLRPGSQRRYLQALRHASLLVGMFGVTAYEALWYHTPMLMFGRTTEDTLGACYLERATNGYHTAGGRLCKYTTEGFCKMVTQCYRATTLPERQVPSFIDGRGTQRVAEAILAL